MATYYGIQEDSDGNVLLPVPNGICGIERGTSATQSYVKGNLVYVGNRLCQVNSAITPGDSLTIGGNISYTSMANQVHNIKVFVNNNGELVFTDHTGADTVLNFSQIYDLGTGTSFNVSSISGYQNFTTANFTFNLISATQNASSRSLDNSSVGFPATSSASITPQLTYNASTGVLTAYQYVVTSGGARNAPCSSSTNVPVHAYLITKTSSIRTL